MSEEKKNSLYFVESYTRCGEMPLYFIVCRNREADRGYCVILCSFRKLRKLMCLRHGFSEPRQFGLVLYHGHGQPSDGVREMLKARFGFDPGNEAMHKIGEY